VEVEVVVVVVPFFNALSRDLSPYAWGRSRESSKAHLGQAAFEMNAASAEVKNE
jgi:hypothetical protein